jgi:hypothetical protein
MKVYATVPRDVYLASHWRPIEGGNRLSAPSQPNLRFSEVRKACPLISDRILSTERKELETCGLISRLAGSSGI